MKGKNNTIYLQHILDCIGKIKKFTEGLNENSFLKNVLVQDAVIRNFEIIGEAVKQLNEEFKIANPQIEWKKLRECETN